VRLRGGNEVDTGSISWYSHGAKLRWYRIDGMKSPIRFAFFLAIPIEAANLYFRDSFADFRISLGSISLDKLLDYQFKFIHWPGLYLSDWLESIGLPKLGFLAIAASGYLDTVILLIALIFLFRSFSGRKTKRLSLPSDPTDV
jgi:hypothetical protein